VSTKSRYTSAELDSRLKFILAIMLGAMVFLIVAGNLYALIFVEQPIGAQAENDKMFFNLLNSIATFITGTLAGILIGKTNSGSEESAPVEVSDDVVVEEEKPVLEGKSEGEMPEETEVDEDWDKD
jgi:hypothetical protein